MKLSQLLKNTSRSLTKFMRPMSLIRKNRQTLKSTDIVLLSFPRSGNTWSRHLLADIVLQVLGFKTDTQLPIEFYKIVPSIYSQDFEAVQDERIHLPYRIIKSHEHKDAKYRKIIYVFRQPKDVLCSFYYFCKANQDPRADLSIDDFCLRQLDN